MDTVVAHHPAAVDMEAHHPAAVDTAVAHHPEAVDTVDQHPSSVDTAAHPAALPMDPLVAMALLLLLLEAMAVLPAVTK